MFIFLQDIENGKYDTTVKQFKDQFQSMMYTPQEVLDQLYDGGGEEFGENDKVVIQVAAEGGNVTTRDRADSGRGGSSIEGSFSSVSERGSLNDSLSRMNIQKSLSLEDEVFHQANGTALRYQIHVYEHYFLYLISKFKYECSSEINLHHALSEHT